MRVLNEVLKYITKVRDGEPDHLVAVYEFFKGRQPRRPWGAMHGLVKLARLEVKRSPLPCEKCGCTNWIPEWMLDMYERMAGQGPPIDGPFYRAPEPAPTPSGSGQSDLF